jgi:copper chaperone CopZ
MDEATFAVPSLTRESEALDLRNAINSLSGVAAVRVDLASHTVTVQFEPSHLSPDLLKACIKGTGYGSAEAR